MVIFRWEKYAPTVRLTVSTAIVSKNVSIVSKVSICPHWGCAMSAQKLVMPEKMLQMIA